MGSLSSSTQLKTTMKFLVLASCVALSAAQYGLVGHPNGAVVPVDEPAVAAARADHFAAGGGRGALGYAGVGYAAAPAIAAAPVAVAAAPVYAAGYGYSGPLNLNTQEVECQEDRIGCKESQGGQGQGGVPGSARGSKGV